MNKVFIFQLEFINYFYVKHIEQVHKNLIFQYNVNVYSDIEFLTNILFKYCIV